LPENQITVNLIQYPKLQTTLHWQSQHHCPHSLIPITTHLPMLGRSHCQRPTTLKPDFPNRK